MDNHSASPDPKGPGNRQAGMIFIFITLFIDILGIGIIIPILPELIKEFVGEGAMVNVWLLGELAAAPFYYGLIASVYALMQFFFAPVLGSLSDRFGRRPVILLALLGLGIDYIILALAPSLTWIFIGRMIAGIMGASFTAANAYIADISTPENRAQNFGLVGVAFGLGFIFGPALGGVLGEFNIRLPFYVSAVLVFLNWLYGYFILPESLPQEQRSRFSWRKANPIGSIGQLRAYPLVAGLAVAFVFISFAQRGLETVWVLFTGFRFGWGELENGLTLALVGVMAAIVQGGLIRPIINRFGERRAIMLSLSISTLTFLLYGLASQGWMMLVVIVIGALGGVAGPAVQGLVAGQVDPSDQGKVQGALTSLISLTSIFAPLVFTTSLFAFFTSERAPVILPGAPFFLGSIFFAISLVIVRRLFRRLPETPKGAESDVVEVSQ